MSRAVRPGVIIVVIAAVALGTFLALRGSEPAPPTVTRPDGVDATVDRVVDGDTLVVELNGQSERVRLLNIDTPESVDPERPAECLGTEASAFLVELLPAGTAVTLVFDDDQRDRYDRLLAGVFTADGAFVNAEIAAAGFTDVVVIGGNDRFEPDIRSAVDRARAASLGIWSSEPAC